MSDSRYFVSSSRAVRQRFRGSLVAAEANGELEMAIRAGDWMLGELARTPLEFGESRDELPVLGLKVRFAFVRPLAMYFAVNEENHVVFLMSVKYSKRTPPLHENKRG